MEEVDERKEGERGRKNGRWRRKWMRRGREGEREEEWKVEEEEVDERNFQRQHIKTEEYWLKRENGEKQKGIARGYKTYSFFTPLSILQGQCALQCGGRDV